MNRKGKLAVLGLYVALVALSAMGASAQSSAASEAGDGVWLGLFTEKGPEDMAETRSLQARLGKGFSSLMWFTDFAHPFPALAAENAWTSGAIPNITWEPWFWDDNDKIHLSDINAGLWDAYISEWGAAAAKFGKPLFLRWGHEFNGDWYPWGIAKNGEDPQAYVKAYRRVRDLVVRSGAKNVIWVWCPNASSVPSREWNDPLLAYPGDEYVDWVAIDGYDFDGNASFSDIFSKTYTAIVRALDKPMYIGEFATGRTGRDKAEWLRDMHESLVSSFPGVKGVVYFSVKKERDWRLDDSPESLAGAKSVLSQSFYKATRESVDSLAGIFRKNYAEYKKRAAPSVAVSRATIAAVRATRDSFGAIDWSKSSPMDVAGKNGLGGAVRFAWDAERLYLRADIKTRFPLSNPQKNDGIWNGACVEVCISTDPKADPARLNFTQTDWQLGFAPKDTAKSLPERSWEWSKLRSPVPGAEIVSKPADGGYTIEASFPWKALREFKPEAGMVLGFDVAVDDAGANGQRSFQWIWNGNNQFYNSPAQWGMLTLAP